jgi:hypothetical protein
MGGQEMNFNGGEGYRKDFKMLCVWFKGGGGILMRDLKSHLNIRVFTI